MKRLLIIFFLSTSIYSQGVESDIAYKLVSKKLGGSVPISFLQEAELVLIENQPSLKNPIMKSVQMLLYSYFLIRGMVDLQKVTDIKLMSVISTLDSFMDLCKTYLVVIYF